MTDLVQEVLSPNWGSAPPERRAARLNDELTERACTSNIVGLG
jgi:hypothetical protein